MTEDRLKQIKDKKDSMKTKLKDKDKTKLTQKEINALVVDIAELLNLL